MGDSWLKSAINSLLGKDELPEPPSSIYRELAKDFARHNPEATVGDWIEFFVHGCQATYREAWRAGYESKNLGVQEMPFDIEPSEEYELAMGDVPLDKVVVIQEGTSMRNVVFTDEHGLAVLEGKDDD